MARCCCIPSRAYFLAPPSKSDLAKIAKLVDLAPDGKTVVHASGTHFAGKQVAKKRFLVTMDSGERRQIETRRARAFLKTGKWPKRRSNRRNTRRGINGPRTVEARRESDARVFALMRENPRVTLREMAERLGIIGHTSLSRRIAKMKERGLVEIVDGAWVVEIAARPRCAPWVRPLTDYNVRTETSVADGARFG
jgi:hypothetical protein